MPLWRSLRRCQWQHCLLRHLCRRLSLRMRLKARRFVLAEPCRTTESTASRGTGFSRQAFEDLVQRGCLSGVSNLMYGKTPDEMSTETQTALINISQPQVPEQVERDGFESQLELAISSGTVDPKSALGQNCTRNWGPDEKEALEHDGACCWFGCSVIDCSGTAHVSRNPTSIQSKSLRSA